MIKQRCSTKLMLQYFRIHIVYKLGELKTNFYLNFAKYLLYKHILTMSDKELPLPSVSFGKIDDEEKPPPRVGIPSTALTITKVQNIPSKQRPSKEWLEFKVLRDDPNDPLKPHSEEAVKLLAKSPAKTALKPEDELLLQAIAADLDRSLSVEEIITYPIKPPKISDECLKELERMPSWLRAMIEVRYDMIHESYKHGTVKFLRSIANRIDSDYHALYKTFNGPLSGDVIGQIDQLENRLIEKYGKEMLQHDGKDETHPGGASTAFRVAGMVAKWKRNKISNQLWEPHFVSRAAYKLRRGLSTKPAAADLAFASDEQINIKVVGSSSESEEEGERWKTKLREQEIQKQDEKELNDALKYRKSEEKKIQKELKKMKKKEKKEKRKESAKKGNSKDSVEKKESAKKGSSKDSVEKKEKGVKKSDSSLGKGKNSKGSDIQSLKSSKSVESELSLSSSGGKKKKKSKKKDELKEKEGVGDGKATTDGQKQKKVKKHVMAAKEKREQMLARGYFRRYSKLFSTGCGDVIDPPKRLEHHYRRDESFHAYIVTLVTSRYFKAFVMFVILFNAVILALETVEEFEDYYEASEILDEIFLAFYLTEAMVKIYAFPYRYWTSGFNIFDFIILTISIIKTIVDWLNAADISVLRVLLIVRALRVLRGISLSVQLQVLVTALVETIKTNILSIVILLVLLVYIAAIVAFYLFGDKPGLEDLWGSVPRGMLLMISFVTLDGWFDLQEQFEEANFQLEGRLFNLICIVLGNFMFSNIFIAIIIMNISEATDVFRERIRVEREEVIRRKKELVFRRQKLDMRQLLSRQKSSPSADFIELSAKFLKLLRHDDLVTMRDICTSPLWMDSCYQCVTRSENTSNLLMNHHRMMADNLLEHLRLQKESKMNTLTMRRGRFNRYMRLKAKLALIKHEILRMRAPPKDNLRIRYAKKGENSTVGKQPSKS